MNNQETTVQIVKPTNIIVYDFETTGFLDKPNIQPIELAVCVIGIDGSRKVAHHYIKCPYDLDPKITELTGITDDKLSTEGLTLEYVMETFRDLLIEAEEDKPFCIVGHNILNFDNPLYGMMMDRLNYSHRINAKDCFDTGGQFKGELLKWNKFDNITHHEYQRRCLEARSRVKWNLTAAGEYYGIASSGIAHSAIGDIENNLQVFIKQLKKIGKLPENLIQHEL